MHRLLVSWNLDSAEKGMKRLADVIDEVQKAMRGTMGRLDY
jgi:hypothetical protein